MDWNTALDKKQYFNNLLWLPASHSMHQYIDIHMDAYQSCGGKQDQTQQTLSCNWPTDRSYLYYTTYSTLEIQNFN